jgi:hypothetical protein
MPARLLDLALDAAVLLIYALFVLLALAGAAAAQTASADRASFGGTKLRPVGTTLRLDDLATTGGAYVLLGDAPDGGNIRSRLLAASDIPAPFTRDDIAETITQAWTFSAGLTGDLNVAGIISPTATTGLTASAGGRMIFGAGFSSPDAGRIYFGDGTGWKLHLTSRISSTNTDRFTFSDTGRFEFREHLLPFTNYTSDLGSSSRKARSVHAGELLIETIVAQQRITTMGGRFTVTPSNILTRDIGTGTAGNISFCVQNASFLLFVATVEWGSKLLMEKNGQFEWFMVTSTTTPTVDATFGDYCYTVDRDVDGSGQNAWTAGDGIIDTGKIGSGMIDQFAVRGLQSATIEGPSIDFLVRTADGVSGLSHRASIGNLNGRYGIVTDTFGFAAGDPAQANIIATASSVKLSDGTDVKIELDGTTGNVFLKGDLLLDGGDVASTGNWSLTETAGFVFAASATIFDPGKAVSWGDADTSIYGLSLSGARHLVLANTEGEIRLQATGGGGLGNVVLSSVDTTFLSGSVVSLELGSDLVVNGVTAYSGTCAPSTTLTVSFGIITGCS